MTYLYPVVANWSEFGRWRLSEHSPQLAEVLTEGQQLSC